MARYKPALLMPLVTDQLILSQKDYRVELKLSTCIEKRRKILLTGFQEITRTRIEK